MPLVNKKVIGLMKDELNGEIISFVGLRAKMYAYLLHTEETVKKANWVKKSASNQITFDDYKNCLLNSEILEKTQNLITSKKHEVYSIRQTKIALSSNDDKRCIQSDDIKTLPWGYKKDAYRMHVD